MIAPPNRGEVFLARWGLAPTPEEVTSLRGLLSKDEQARAQQLVTPRLSARLIAARAGLRSHLGAITGIAPEALRFEYGPMGKPHLAASQGEPLHFNLAHSGDLALLAVAREPVGVDLEQTRPLPSASRIATRWFHPEEIAQIEELPSERHEAEFFRIWTLKEAVLKLVGSGVGESLPAIRTPSDPEGGSVELPANNTLGLSTCWAGPIQVADGYQAALAMPSKPMRIPRELQSR